MSKKYNIKFLNPGGISWWVTNYKIYREFWKPQKSHVQRWLRRHEQNQSELNSSMEAWHSSPQLSHRKFQARGSNRARGCNKKLSKKILLIVKTFGKNIKKKYRSKKYIKFLFLFGGKITRIVIVQPTRIVGSEFLDALIIIWTWDFHWKSYYLNPRLRRLNKGIITKVWVETAAGLKLA